VRVGLDGKSLQVAQHARDGVRLASLLAEWTSNLGASFSTLDSLDDRALDGLDVVVTATRTYPPLDEELQSLRSFVTGGRGLLVLTNHADWPGHNDHDHTRHDRPIVELFGLRVERAWFRTPEDLTSIVTEDFRSDHPIVAGGRHGRSVESIVFNNCSAMATGTSEWIVRLPRTTVDERGGLSPDGLAFAAAVSRGEGRVVAVADSGFIGTPGSHVPGPGLLDRGSNLQFATNALLWAAGRL
jgi:hypothetical protein